MVNFKKISIKNFMSIGEAEVDLNTGGFTLINAVNNRVEDSAGSNGSGKSSIAESILWCLTGETIRGHKEVVNRYTEGDCEVKIEFDFKGQNWAVERSMSRSKEKSLLVYKNSVLLESKGYRDSQEVLQKELPELTSKFINSVIVLGQGLPGRFTNNTPSGRKAVLEELTNADFMITQIKENIKFRAEVLSSKLRGVEDSLLRCNTRSEVVKNRVSSDSEKLAILNEFNLQAHLDKKAEIESRVSSLVSDLELNESDLIRALDQSNSARDLWKEKEAKLESDLLARNSQLVNEVSEIKERYSKKLSESTISLKERMVKGSQLIKEVEEQIQHNRARVTGGVCRTCGQRLSGITEDEIVLAKKNIEVLEGKLSQYRDLYRQLQDSENTISINLKNEEAFEISKARDKAEKDSDHLTKESALSITKLKGDYDKLRDESSRLSLRRGKISEDLDLSKEALRAIVSKIEGHQKEVEDLEKELVELNKELATFAGIRESAETEIGLLKSRIAVVKQMETFASRDFRGILLEGIISKMNDIVGNYSEIVYGNRLTSFYLSGNSIQIEFDGKEYESLSGGEQQKMNVILQLSLRDLIIELTGNTGSILFLDEIFDGLDSVGCEKMVDLVQKIDLSSVFIISHRSESLFIPYDHILTVVKESNGVAHIERGV